MLFYFAYISSCKDLGLVPRTHIRQLQLTNSSSRNLRSSSDWPRLALHLSIHPHMDICINIFFVLGFYVVFKTGSQCVALAGLELCMLQGVQNSQEILPFLFLSTRIKGVYHHTWHIEVFLFLFFFKLLNTKNEIKKLVTTAPTKPGLLILS